MWCEACQDHFPRDHYTEDGMRHKVGVAYGPTGQRMLRQEQAILTLARAERDLSEALRHGCNPGAIRAVRNDMRAGLAIQRKPSSLRRLKPGEVIQDGDIDVTMSGDYNHKYARPKLDTAPESVLDSGRGK